MKWILTRAWLRFEQIWWQWMLGWTSGMKPLLEFTWPRR